MVRWASPQGGNAHDRRLRADGGVISKRPRAVRQRGKVVLSRLAAGRSVIGSAAPSVKMVLDRRGDSTRSTARAIRVRAGEMLYLDAGDGLRLRPPRGKPGPLPDAAAGAGVADPTAADPLLGRAFAFSAATSQLGRALAGLRPAASPPLRPAGPALAPTIIAHVGAALAEPLDACRAAAAGLDAAKPSTRRDILQRLERARAHLHDHLDRNVALGRARLGRAALAIPPRPLFQARLRRRAGRLSSRAEAGAGGALPRRAARARSRRRRS